MQNTKARLGRALAALALVSMAAGCGAGSADGEDDTGVAEQALTSTCVTIQRATGGVVADSHIAGGPAQAQNFGTSQRIAVGNAAGLTHQGLLSFDLSAIPSGAAVLSATLTLEQRNASGAGVVSAHVVTAPWAEATVTFNSFAAAFDPSIGASQNNLWPSLTGPLALDLTSMVQGWLAGSSANNGLLLEQTGGANTLFQASEPSGPKGPSLTVCYDTTCLGMVDGAPCDDNQACTAVDTCQAGVCVGSGIPTYYLDADGDGVGTSSVSQSACVPPAGYVLASGDCNDGDAAVFPGAPELCDGLDNDCDGMAEDVGNKWTKVSTGSGQAWFYGVSTDASGNVFATGSTRTGPTNFGGPYNVGNTKSQTLLVKYSSAGTFLWAKGFGTTGLGNAGYGIVNDAAGNVYMTGTMEGSVDFGGGNLVSAGSGDIFVAKFDTNGNHIWSHNYGDSQFQQPWDMALDALGNLVIVGPFSGAVSFGGATLTTVNSAGYIAKLDPNGNHIFSVALPGTFPRKVAVDATGGVFVTGSGSNLVNLGGGPIVASSQGEVFLTKYDAAGAYQWGHLYGPGQGHGLVVDSAGNVTVTGDNIYQGPLDLGGGPLPSYPNSFGYRGAFQASFDNNGVHRYSFGIGGPTDTFYTYGAAVNSDDEVVIIGAFAGTYDFGFGPLTAGGPSLYWPFVAEYDSLGAPQAVITTPAAAAIIEGVTFDANDAMIFVGTFLYDATFAGVTYTSNLWDTMAVKYGSDTCGGVF